MTLKQIYENIKLDFPDYTLTTIAIDVSNVYSDFCYKTRLPRKAYNLALTTATTYTLAATVNQVYEVEIRDDTGQLSDIVSYEIDNGLIKFHDPNGGHLSTMPSTVNSITIYYHSTPAAGLTPASTPDIPVQFHPALIEGVSAKYYRRAKDFQNALLAKQAYNEYVQDGKRHCNINGLTRHNVMPDIMLNEGWAANTVNSESSNSAPLTINNLPYGTTAERPILTIADIGYIYFDTTINSPIWWNGTEWV